MTRTIHKLDIVSGKIQLIKELDSNKTYLWVFNKQINEHVSIGLTKLEIQRLRYMLGDE